MYRHFFKRLFDLTVALIGLPFFCLIFLVLAPIIWLTDRGPVFYNAERLGYKGKTFKMFKFRSMYVNSPDVRNADGTTFNGETDPRVTPIGRFMKDEPRRNAAAAQRTVRDDEFDRSARPFDDALRGLRQADAETQAQT